MYINLNLMLLLSQVIMYNMSKHAVALRVIVDTALEYPPLQGILERISSSKNTATQIKCLQAMEGLIQVDAGTALGMVAQVCKPAS